ncbi:MAG TPA: TetR/AcrR family transcriptional regulator [Ktedonobacteraceae bacterium]|nr:TetR/AcrR family transcriptional regulator [Ktedonobacteraceae bacterium]
MSQSVQIGEHRANRVQQRKERVLAAILEGAERQFLERGYTATTLETIATTANVGVGTIYSYFGGKDDLFLAVIERSLDMLETYQAPSFASEESPRQQLVSAGEAYLRFASDHPRHFHLLTFSQYDASHISPDSRAAERYARLCRRIDGLIDRLANVVQGMVAGGAQETLNAYQIAHFLWGAWNGVITLCLRNNAHRLDTPSAEAVLMQGRRLLFAGIEALLSNATDGQGLLSQ